MKQIERGSSIRKVECWFPLDLLKTSISVEDMEPSENLQWLAIVFRTEKDGFPIIAFCDKNAKLYRGRGGSLEGGAELHTSSFLVALSRAQLKKLAIEITKALKF